MQEARKRAEEWIRLDPNPSTKAYVDNLLQQQHDKELKRLFPDNGCRIQFGTAGLRSCMQPGPMGMNDLVVIQTAQGLAKYVLQEQQQQQQHVNSNTTNSNSNSPHKVCAVVGYDHRSTSKDHPYHVSSLSFAIYTALVFREAGFDCFLLNGFVATPLVAYGVSRFVPETRGSSSLEGEKVTTVGVMITASHNPAPDAGYKVYWTDGCQIRSPIDQGIAACIQQNLQPWTDYQKLYHEQTTMFPNDPCLGLSRPEETKQLVKAYYKAVLESGLVTKQAQTWQAAAIPKFCYTAMHGVGHAFAQQSFANFGLAPFCSVPAQQDPDPTFPTVAFPNPEEKGALDLAKAYAQANHCSVILAHDPDADRLAVSEYDAKAHRWNDLTGDQIGALLGHWLWTNFKDQETMLSDGTRKVLTVSMCCSTVSSQMLATMGKQEGFHVEDTLTGFKWIGSRAAELSKSEQYRQVFCYEEAIGYCCGDVIFDKDGVTACAVFAELAVHVYCQQGQTLVQHLQGLYGKYGEFVSNNGYYILQDASTVVPQIMDHITNGAQYDRTFVGNNDKKYDIASIRYLGEPGYDSTTADQKPTLPTSASSPMVTIRFTNGGVAQFRASGTEPKFKYYMELSGQPGVDRATVERECQVWSQIVLEELIQPTKFGLQSPGFV